ncbi:MAG: PucR family transcriptional regulator ligand-binding domain-containing protein [Lachnospiraceae bacterium]
MPITLNDILQSELYQMGYTPVIPELPLNTTVTGLSYIESEEMCYLLKGNELVIVTGCAFLHPSDFLSLIRLLKQKHCSGVLLTLGLYLHEIPEDVIAYCSDSKLPVFSIPHDKFSTNRLAHLSHTIYHSKTVYSELCRAFKNALSSSEEDFEYLSLFRKNHYPEETVFCVGIVELFKYNPDTKQKTYLKNKQNEIQKFLDSEYENVISIAANNQFIFFFPNCEDYIARDIIMDVYHLIRSNDLYEYIYLGTSEKFYSLKDIKRAYKQADFVTMLKKKAVLRTPIIRFSSLHSYKLLASIEDEQVLINYYKQHLEPLLEYDSLHKSSYFKLLEVLIQNDFNVAETASKLYMHRNSVNYKLNKIESILHCSLTTVSDKSILLEAYKIWCILYKEESIPDRRRRNPAVTIVSTATGDDRDEISLRPENCSN